MNVANLELVLLRWVSVYEVRGVHYGNLMTGEKIVASDVTHMDGDWLVRDHNNAVRCRQIKIAAGSVVSKKKT